MATALANELDAEEHFEVVDGQRVELPPMSAYASFIASQLLLLLGDFVRAKSLGLVVAETLFRWPPPLERDRRPDVAFVSYQRWPKGKPLPPLDNAWSVVPDLAAEVLSPNDGAEDLLAKIAEYFRVGVRCVWVVSPLQRSIHVYHSVEQVQLVTWANDLDGGNVLPGFRMPLAALFPDEAPAHESR